jgi:hypothetical protein
MMLNKMVSASSCLSAISDDKSLVLFNTIALASGDSTILKSKFQLTRKQYYSRMTELINAGLISRKNGKYFLTSFGKIVYEAQVLIGKAVQYYSKLKAIDSIESADFPAAEHSKIIETLISSTQIKEILISQVHTLNPAENEKGYNNEVIVSAPTRCSIQSDTKKKLWYMRYPYEYQGKLK